MPAINGSAYLKRIKDLKAEIWLEGKKITGCITEHQAFKGILNSKARLYDLQLEDSKKDFMTFTSPLTGERVGTSYLIPRSKEDLEKRRLTTQEWAKTSGGMMGRSPDYMNTGLMALAAAWEEFEDDNHFGRRLKGIYEHARENDLTFAHTFLSPQMNRSVGYCEQSEEPISARVVKTTNEGLIIKGARVMATQGGLTDEILLLPVGGSFIEEPFIYAFSIPSSTPGLKFLCRESFAYRPSKWDHPLGARFEEMDATVVFNNVLVPWERVFLHKNYSVLISMYEASKFYPFLLHQIVSRQVIKTQFLLGAAQLMVNAIDIGDYHHVKDKVCEMITGFEVMRALLFTSELEARKDERGVMIPSGNSLYAAITMFPKLYPRLIEIIQLLGAGGIISIPTESDFQSPIQEDLLLYAQGSSCDAETKNQIFRLAWDISTSAYGGRQTLYERFFFGDPERIKTGIYNSYPRDDAMQMVKEMLDS
ncbi:4-hydroxyphenylacetate 3-monooxygenase, oxygenase component [Peribacillus sp. SCS-37]|uniref:4-hydroxyphenylacetate 3-monooxygenase, oxygenase component n=1 Tax=Paraperibacillus esterisolvens TaxID=3115296 RepID=UPI0039068732